MRLWGNLSSECRRDEIQVWRGRQRCGTWGQQTESVGIIADSSTARQLQSVWTSTLRLTYSSIVQPSGHHSGSHSGSSQHSASHPSSQVGSKHASAQLSALHSAARAAAAQSGAQCSSRQQYVSNGHGEGHFFCFSIEPDDVDESVNDDGAEDDSDAVSVMVAPCRGLDDDPWSSSQHTTACHCGVGEATSAAIARIRVLLRTLDQMAG